jgi:hypothetical protein
MIANETELLITQQRIAKFQGWLVDLRKTARPEEFSAVTSGYRLEIERMQAEVLDFLLRPVEDQSQPVFAERVAT